ncbi:MAG: methyltransferase domain-containing protein [Gemmatimonadota bacterium]|nr:methyltransferase domain-containing protein [Gemmatimonadota bacterium]
MRLAPARYRGIEYLDDRSVSADLRRRSLRDVARANTLLGGAHAVLAELDRVLPGAGSRCTLLDVGTGLGDLPRRAQRRAGRRGVDLVPIGCDVSPAVLKEGSRCAAAGDALALPFRSRSVDVVVCSQLLHHFEFPDARRVLRELDRVARRAVIVSDLRRSWIAAGGFWLVSWLLGFHAITRHDGVTSVRRGFTAGELAAMVREATGADAHVSRHPGYRLTARWAATGSAA